MSLIYIDLGRKASISVRDLSKVNVDLIQGPWIAGGAALSAYTGNPLNDVDIYFPTVELQVNTLEELKKVRDLAFSSDNATTFKRPNRLNIQVIKKVFPTVKDVFAGFDFTVCQIATDCTGKFVGTAQAFRDIAAKKLSVNKFVEDKFLPRWAKYTLYGYTMETVEFKEYARKCDEDSFNRIGLFDGNY